jgi:hypothetical protein
LRRKQLLLPVLVCINVLAAAGTGLTAQNQIEVPAAPDTLSAAAAGADHQFEFTLPSGNVAERIEQRFNNLQMVFSFNFNFLNSSIGADVAFSYPLGFFVPGVRFYQVVDLENLVAPQFQGGELTLLPSEKYVSRDRGVGIEFMFNVTPAFSITPSFLMNDTFKGSLATDLSLDKGIDWIAELSFAVDQGRNRPAGGPEPRHRVVFGSQFYMRFRDELSNPASIDHRSLLKTYHRFGEHGTITDSLGLSYPIFIWNTEISRFYSLGGFDTIRGYSYGSIAAFRYLLNRLDLGFDIFQNAGINFKVLKRSMRIHDYTLFLIIDGLLAQDHLSWDTPVQIYGGCGAGFSFLMSGQRGNHLKLSAYAVQPVVAGRLPIFYFQMSFFSFEQQTR